MKRWTTIRAYLAPPVFPGDAEKTRRAVFLNSILLTCAVFALCLIGGNLAGGAVPAAVTGLNGGLFVGCFVLRRWANQGRIRLASSVLLATGLGGIALMIAIMGTIRTPATAAYMLLVIATGLLLDMGSMIVMAGACALILAGLIVAEHAGWLPRPDYVVSITQWVTYTVLFAWAGSLTFSALGSTRRALTHAEQELAERQRAEAVLRDVRWRLENIIEGAHIGTWECNVQTGTTVINVVWAQIAGYTLAELAPTGSTTIQETWEALAHPDDLKRTAVLLARHFAREVPDYDDECRMRHKDGHWVWVHVRGRVVTRDSADQPLLMFGTHTDISARKQAEEQLIQRLADLERSNKELQQFAYVASHDLQEPLRMVSSYTQLLARRYQGQLGTDADEFIAYAVDGANRMQTLINDLLAYSRVGTHGKGCEPTDCTAVLAQALINLKVAIEQSGAVVTHDPLPTVLADKLQMVQVFQNLIGNAIKFHGGEPPRVQVSAEQKGPEWVFTVRDNGVGIEPQYAERIFVIFQRLHTREEYPGTGIGLAICKKIVERHGGRIWMESQLGLGATFYFTMPIGGNGL